MDEKISRRGFMRGLVGGGLVGAIVYFSGGCGGAISGAALREYSAVEPKPAPVEELVEVKEHYHAVPALSEIQEAAGEAMAGLDEKIAGEGDYLKRLVLQAQKDDLAEKLKLLVEDCRKYGKHEGVKAKIRCDE